MQEGLDIVSGFSPDVLLFQAGVDALASDALGKLKVSRSGMRLRNQMVLSHVVDQGLPCVIFMGGGTPTRSSTPWTPSSTSLQTLRSQMAACNARLDWRTAS